MSERMISRRKKEVSSNFTNPSLISPTSPTLASPIPSFTSPQADTISPQKAPFVEFGNTQSVGEEISQAQLKSHDVSRISLSPQPRLTIQPKEQQAGEEVRQRVESVTGYDLSHTQINPSSTLASVAGVEALTVGKEIHIAPGYYKPETTHGKHVLAHEFAHVVQQGTGATENIAVSDRRFHLETQADLIAHQATSQKPNHQSKQNLAIPNRPIAQAFDPRYHRQSVVEGLVGTGFSPEQIGDIYAANWERDFSQAHPALGNIVLAWKNVKLAASQNRLTDNEIHSFEGTVDNLVAMIPFRVGELASGEAYGGYKYYEHMDNPGVKDLLTKPKGETIPQYMVDSRDYIKAQLFRAAKAYRGDMSDQSQSGQTAANFNQRAEERAKQIPGGQVLPGGNSTSPVAVEATDQAKREPVVTIGLVVVTAQGQQPQTINTGENNPRPGSWTPEVADAMGRASHALEDFFAHSNFVELAIGEPAPVLTGIDEQGNKHFSDRELGTGTFGAADKKHSLSHKIRALADEIDSEMPLVNRVTGRTKENPSPEQVNTGSTNPPTEEHEEVKSWWDVIGKNVPRNAAIGGVLGTMTGGLVGGLVGAGIGAFTGLNPEVRDILTTVVGSTLIGIGSGALIGTGALGVIGTIGGGIFGGVQGLQSGIKAAASNVIATPRGVGLLRRAAELLEQQTRTEAEAGSHTKLAKDQPGHEDNPFGRLRSIKFKLAQELAATADGMILGRMRQVFDAPSPESADSLLQDIHTTLNQMIAAPSSGHPLSNIIEARHDEAAKALEEYQKTISPD